METSGKCLMSSLVLQCILHYKTEHTDFKMLKAEWMPFIFLNEDFGGWGLKES